MSHDTALHFLPRVLPVDDLDALPPGFEPLHLVLMPGAMIVEINRPEAIVGRHSRSDVRLPQPDVSRRHCRLLFQAGRWWIEDLRSLNGVCVNEQRVETQELQPGDRLRIGAVTLVVQSAEPTGAILRTIAAALSPEPIPQRRAS